MGKQDDGFAVERALIAALIDRVEAIERLVLGHIRHHVDIAQAEVDAKIDDAHREMKALITAHPLPHPPEEVTPD